MSYREEINSALLGMLFAGLRVRDDSADMSVIVDHEVAQGQQDGASAPSRLPRLGVISSHRQTHIHIWLKATTFLQHVKSY